MKSLSPPPSTPCPCGSLQPYDRCCGLIHQHYALTGRLSAQSAEALMRSRYSAYVHDLTDYLLASWHASTRPATLARNEPGLRWLGLDVKESAQQDEQHATVEFVARSKMGGRAQCLHEVSRFVREDGSWYYLDGQY